MNSLTAYALGKELGRALIGRKITGVDSFDYGLTIGIEDKEIPFLHLIFASREAELIPGKNRIFPKSRSRQAFETIEGAVISAIRPVGLDRIILVSLQSKDSWGKEKEYSLRIDMAPAVKALSLFELPEKKLLGSIGATGSRAPESPYESPPSKRWDLLSLPGACPEDILSQAVRTAKKENGARTRKQKSGESDLADLLVRMISGMDPVLSSILVRKNDGALLRVWHDLEIISERLSSSSFIWNIYDLPEIGDVGQSLLYPVPIPAPSRPEGPSGFMAGLEAIATEKIIPLFTEKYRNRILSIVRRDINKSRKLFENLSDDLARADMAGEMRLFGNLLSTFRHLLRPGMKEIELRDFSGEKTITVPLDPALSPDQNIKKYYRKAKKGEKGRLVIRNHRISTEKELGKKLEMFEKISATTEMEELLAFLPEKSPGRDRSKDPGEVERFRKYILDRDHIVLVGRNDRENDYLTHRYASPNDLWFHAQGSPGSHVVLRRSTFSTPGEFIEKAAEIAAWFSKARNSATVAVIYTEKRYVRKPRKSRPGSAICSRERTIFVSPVRPPEKAKKDIGGKS
ncbi:MAG: DUF814 domain-containing protein [Candidatus Krumholzibacteriota bacterium]|nr:DUF814 domain-containing protein [Candidatus Krumholzibacteriota bacterium]